MTSQNTLSLSPSQVLDASFDFLELIIPSSSFTDHNASHDTPVDPLPDFALTQLPHSPQPTRAEELIPTNVGPEYFNQFSSETAFWTVDDLVNLEQEPLFIMPDASYTHALRHAHTYDDPFFGTLPTPGPSPLEGSNTLPPHEAVDHSYGAMTNFDTTQGFSSSYPSVTMRQQHLACHQGAAMRGFSAAGSVVAPTIVVPSFDTLQLDTYGALVPAVSPLLSGCTLTDTISPHLLFSTPASGSSCAPQHLPTPPRSGPSSPHVLADGTSMVFGDLPYFPRDVSCTPASTEDGAEEASDPTYEPRVSSVGPVRRTRGRAGRRNTDSDGWLFVEKEKACEYLEQFTPGGRHYCKRCGASARRQGDALRHIQSCQGVFVKDKEQKLRCAFCHKAFPRVDARRRHENDGWCRGDDDKEVKASARKEREGKKPAAKKLQSRKRR